MVLSQGAMGTGPLPGRSQCGSGAWAGMPSSIAVLLTRQVLPCSLCLDPEHLKGDASFLGTAWLLF